MNRTTIKNILTNTVVFLVILVVISCVYFLAFRETTFSWWLLAVPFFLMQLIRVKVKNVYTFIALHVLTAAGAVLVIGNSDTIWFVLAFMIASVVYSLIIHASGECSLGAVTGIFITVFHIIFSLIVRQVNNSAVIQQQLVGTFIITIGMIIAHIHMDNIDINLSIVNHIDNRTHRADKILTANNALIFVFIVITFIIGIGVATLPLRQIIASGVRAISTPFSILRQHENDLEPSLPPVLTEAIYEHIQENIQPAIVPPVDEVDPEQLQAFVNRVFSIIFVFLLAIIIFALYLFIRYFYNRRKKQQNTDPDSDENIALGRNIIDDFRDLLPKFNRYSKNPIRRAYAKKINWHIRRGADVRKSDTTDIIADKIRKAEDIDELTAMYEKARYFE
ncbi:MAG: hypothetical protein FWE42_09165 [Defluviitaleaceae bacterium]|nr:hypothetical protein [Defluviitaleaceae bacterium]